MVFSNHEMKKQMFLKWLFAKYVFKGVHFLVKFGDEGLQRY